MKVGSNLKRIHLYSYHTFETKRGPKVRLSLKEDSSDSIYLISNSAPEL